MLFRKYLGGGLEQLNIPIGVRVLYNHLLFGLFLALLYCQSYLHHPLLLQYFLLGSEGNVLKPIVDDEPVLVLGAGLQSGNFQRDLELLLGLPFVHDDEPVSLVHHVEVSPRPDANHPLKYLNITFHYNN